MAWQETAALGIVAATVGMFAWNVWRSRQRPAKSHCGCDGCGSPGVGRPPSIVFRARKGELGRLAVKL
jgi:hypothetical protein